MDMNFVQRANEIEQRLEAEGMYLTAEAMRKVVEAYIRSETNELYQMCKPKVSKQYQWLT
ncbi:hypothetical protein RKLH11_3565 [Rhodobacteraceae bacterium KLH11]|nr:hypothetical protein RKLH11_3565 [Rhodobacteraceae bacterium KLH11]